MRPNENWIFKIHEKNGIKSLNRLRSNFNHFKKHKFQHNFSLEQETTLHNILRCSPYFDLRIELLNDICALNLTLKFLNSWQAFEYSPVLEDFSFNTIKKVIKFTYF